MASVLKTVDLVIHARWVIPIVPEGFLEHHSLVIEKKRILDLLPTDLCKAKYTGAKELDLSEEHVLLPGLVNTHCHSPMSLLRGYAEDCNLMDWLIHYMWPAEGQWVDEEFVRVGSSLTILEMLRNGVTCFNDMYFFPEVTAQVVEESGMRAVIGTPVVMFPSSYAQNQDDYLHKAVPLLEKYKNHERIKVAVAPHSPYTVNDEGLTKAKELANRYQAKLHIHVHETEQEIENHISDPQHGGARPIERLRKLGLFDKNMIAVHMTQLIEEEVNLVSKTGASIASCPSSNLKLGSGSCPVNQLVKMGVNVALGTDGPASNDDVSILCEMRTTTLLDRHARSAQSLHVHQILQMATLNGAKCLGLEKEIGSLEIGKEADVVAIKLETHPIYNPIHTLIYVASNRADYVWVAGKLLVERGNVLAFDTEGLKRQAKEWGRKIHQWDTERRQLPMESVQTTLAASHALIKQTEHHSSQEVLQTMLQQLLTFRDPLFHAIFFANLPHQTKKGHSLEDLENTLSMLNNQVQQIEGLLKNVVSP